MLLKSRYTVIALLYLFSVQLNAASLKIAFGSCYDQNKPSVNIWHVIAKKQPDLVLLEGDNVYIDSVKAEKFEESYNSLRNNKGFQELKKQSTIMATWDDHDYGLQDGGKFFVKKEMAKQYFTEFFEYPELKNLNEKDGVQHSREIMLGNKTIRIIMLDTRWYRDKLVFNSLSPETRERFELGPYRPSFDRSKTLLGERQWTWLETILAKPVDLNILVSSIQFLSEYTGWELWANFPHERRKMIDLLNQYSHGKAIIISGDVHRAEVSEVSVDDWLLYDITASGLTSAVYPSKPNVNRVGNAYSVNNFGMLYIEDGETGLNVMSVLYDDMGNELSTNEIPVNH